METGIIPAFVHCRLRAKQRLGIRITDLDYLSWCESCHARKQGKRWTQDRKCLAFSLHDPKGRGRELHRLKSHGASLYAVYDRESRVVVTIYSTDDIIFEYKMEMSVKHERDSVRNRKKRMQYREESMLE